MTAASVPKLGAASPCAARTMAFSADERFLATSGGSEAQIAKHIAPSGQPARLRQRFVQRLEPLTEDEHLELIRSALERAAEEEDPNGRRPNDSRRAQAARAED